MSTSKSYPPQFREEAVRLVKESGKSVSRIAKDLGIAYETLRRWIRQAEVDAGEHEGLTTSEREELAQLRLVPSGAVHERTREHKTYRDDQANS